MRPPLTSLRMTLRFVLPLLLVLGAFAYSSVPLMDQLNLRWFMRDLDLRSATLAATLEDPLQDYVPQKAKRKIMQLFDRAILDERLFALGFCDPRGELIYKTATWPKSLGCARDAAPGRAGGRLVDLPQGAVHVTVSTLQREGEALGKLILVHDMSFIERRSADTRKYVMSVFLALGVAISLITVVIARISWRGWLDGVRGVLRGGIAQRAGFTASPEMLPLIGDLRALLNEYQRERLSDDDAKVSAPDKLRALLHNELAGDEVLVVSNREPYIHVKTPEGVEVRRPASGLVTAVEAVMRACSGTWIAHGAGNADRDVVDAHGRVPVPPGHSSYTLRRVWLSKEEEQGYYYGFANEGMWPLCHIAHVRPIFRSSDWEQYVAVNRRFADAVVAEARTEDPVVLVQDYHFALLPRMVRERLPRATIITFWHIPWPNSESFGICPWRAEILEGMLGSTILGFHTPLHRRNFMDTVDRYLETRIEEEASTISYGGKLTQVQSYPISIAWPEAEAQTDSVPACRAAIRRELGLAPDHLLGIGVDRLDYTKGILERFQAVERMLERYPEMVGRFTFVQIAAPSRSSLDEYQNFEARVRSLVQRINVRFGSGGYLPIVLKAEHHEHEAVNRYYRAAEVCMVTSLHDGMNLVAKEFIAARDDERGALVLSQFTGAAMELHAALIINPYHIEQGAEALYRGLMMPAAEQAERMRSMRMLVRDFNVYRWAGRMLHDAARLRQRERVMSKIAEHGAAPGLRRVV
ncbi:trehalose-6-phosphate synthase [Noviherbaspirillum sp. DKR-6]|uniref:Trehalose-6-phosphate synthase n=2 Tax=Noviherbaspirillum pedocola TaxID=2801341 RepID=A0A934W942_9BURK|nr:trehalose-6-phosphate synthase [Noviherbaspirillum pedocola]MBK4736569.1 trehalose-6-phosphate synthase [Noviherbaspirillum pedocola]